MASNIVRGRVPLIIGGSIVYVAACTIAYQSIKRSKQDVDETNRLIEANSCSCSHKFSFVDNPNRTDQFQLVAKSYDEQIGRDESVMGVNLLRRSLLYFNATGTVLEVGAGTGRNLPYYPSKSVDRVLLTDTSDQMLSKAKQKIKDMTTTKSNNSSKKPQFACMIADSSNLSEYPDNYFDTVVDTFGLCSYDDPLGVLMELQRVCKKPDGKILLLEHGRSKSWDFITSYLDKHAERHAKNWGCDSYLTAASMGNRSITQRLESRFGSINPEIGTAYRNTSDMAFWYYLLRCLYAG